MLRYLLPFLCLFALTSFHGNSAPAAADFVVEEKDGILAFEAEHYYKTTLTETRSWRLTTAEQTPEVNPDGDPNHAAGASGGAYLECLPDTRRNHGHKLIKGENFSNEPGEMAILHYKVRVEQPGRYYCWARVFSTTSEDNGMHFGLNGQWPESGRRWQTVGKHKWHWDCKQRTEKVHVGVPMQLWLDIDEAGDHEIQVSMREDGTEIDKFVLALAKDYKPKGLGPELVVAAGEAPAAHKFVAAEPALVEPRKPDGTGVIEIGGELKQWHKVMLTLDGPFAHERDNWPNPFTDYALNVTFTHESGEPKYIVPGYFAADGDAGNSSADSGVKWRAHLSPDKVGSWKYEVAFRKGKHVALNGKGQPLKPFDGFAGEFTVGDSDKTGSDFRAHGRLQYVSGHHLQFAGSEKYFLKAGPDAPETLLAYTDFDNTIASNPNKAPLKTWEPHLQDWRDGDPTWKDGKGKGLIGALNYLADKGVNSFSFLPYNAGGDGDNIWPFVQREAKLNYDCSKLDQWGVVFDHATNIGLHLHFKLQENEMDDNRLGHEKKNSSVPESLDGGELGPERKLYCRELIARFGHALALNWNIGEECTQSTEEIVDMLGYIRDVDPYDHNRVIHTFPQQQDQVYEPLLGDASELTGPSLQNHWDASHKRALKWLAASAKAGKPWIVAQDEQGPAQLGVPQDIGYRGTDGVAKDKEKPAAAGYTMHDIRKLTLWGNLMAGGAGVEYYFGYKLPENDLRCEDFRSRDKSWDYCRIAIDFFHDNEIPFWEMQNANALVGNTENNNSKFCFAKKGEVYLVYLPNGGTTNLDLSGANDEFSVRWFNPREGGELKEGSIQTVKGDATTKLGSPPANPDEDWLAVIRRAD